MVSSRAANEVLLRAASNAQPARSGGIDALRILSVVAIVVGHTWANDVTHKTLYSWHVPVFFILSGYLWTAGRSVSIEVGNRFRTLLIPYVVWLIILFLPYVGALFLAGGLGLDDVLRPILGGSQNGGPFGTFWFMTALFFAAVFFRILERTPIAVRLFIIAGGLAAAYRYGEPMSTFPLSIGVAVPALVFLYAGVLLRRIRSWVTQPLLIGVVLLAVGFTPVLQGLVEPLDMKKADFGTPVLSVLGAVALSFGLLLICEAMFNRLGSRANKLAILIASGALMVVLTHTFILAMMRVPLDERQLWILIPVLILPWLSALAVRRTRLAPYLVGTPQLLPITHRRN